MGRVIVLGNYGYCLRTLGDHSINGKVIGVVGAKLQDVT